MVTILFICVAIGFAIGFFGLDLIFKTLGSSYSVRTKFTDTSIGILFFATAIFIDIASVNKLEKLHANKVINDYLSGEYVKKEIVVNGFTETTEWVHSPVEYD